MSEGCLANLVFIDHPEVFLILYDGVKLHVVSGSNKFDILYSLDFFIILKLIFDYFFNVFELKIYVFRELLDDDSVIVLVKTYPSL